MSLNYKLHQLRTFASDWRYLPFFVQRRFRSPGIRDRLSRILAARKLPGPTPGSAELPLAQALQHKGIAHLGELLTKSQIVDITRYFEGQTISDPYQPEAPAFLPHAAERPFNTHVGYYRTQQVIAAPHLLALANRPEILAIAGAFLGCKPTIGYLASWWSFAADGKAQAAENFHRDVDDWRFVKLFVYLTDVTHESGPHIYVTGSAQDSRLRDIRRYTDLEVQNAFGEQAIVTNIGKAGSGFLENTYGLHKGQPVKEGKRLIFQAVYSMSSLPYAPKKAVMSLADAATVCPVPLDPYVNRLYLRDGAD